MDDINAKLEALEQGDSAAAEELLPIVYAELRRLASQQLAREGAGHTLQATALVHEVYLRLIAPELDRTKGWAGKAAFFAAAAKAMRRILIDHARARACVKRGGDGRVPAKKVTLDAATLAQSENPDDLMAVDHAISRLEIQDADLARLVRLRFFVGLSTRETAEALGISERTVRREWTLAKAWLRRELSHEAGKDE